MPPEDVTTANWQALEQYSNAERLADSHNLLAAVDALQDALVKDPEFAMADALLGDLEVQLNRSQAGYKAFEEALALDTKRRLSLRERDRIKGIVAHDMADFEAAEAAYREYTLYYPNDYLAWFRRGRPLLMMGRVDESIDVLMRAHELDPERGGIVMQLARANYVRDNLSEAHRWLAELERLGSRDNLLYQKGAGLFIEGDYDGAEALIREVAASTDSAYATYGVQMLAELFAERGRFKQARDLLSQRLQIRPGAADLLLDRAQLEAKLEDYPAAIADIDTVLSADNSPGRVLTAATLLGRATAEAPPGAVPGLRRALELLRVWNPDKQRGPIFDVARYRLRGEIAMARKDAAGALDQFLRADKLEAPFHSREYLARAYTLAAAHQANPAQRTEMLQRAALALATTALHPATIWQYPAAYPPGFYADQLEAWLNIASRDPSSLGQREQMLDRLGQLRPQNSALVRATPQGSPQPK